MVPCDQTTPFSGNSPWFWLPVPVKMQEKQLFEAITLLILMTLLSVEIEMSPVPKDNSGKCPLFSSQRSVSSYDITYCKAKVVFACYAPLALTVGLFVSFRHYYVMTQSKSIVSRIKSLEFLLFCCRPIVAWHQPPPPPTGLWSYRPVVAFRHPCPFLSTWPVKL